ncbi:MAG TPA: PHP domain-containing protein [Candidatus Nanoarchaeia archaeon]|nr:3',5'-nucleoside bisphosphate phosphatase [uncultured archaeon]
MARFVDLHTHTVYSDGGLTPNQLVVEAKKAKLSAIAVTDHDNTKATEVATLKGQELGVEVVPAVEITAYIDSRNDLHILGYFIDPRNHILQKKLEFYQKERERVAKEIVENLEQLGYKITFKDLRDTTKGTIVKPHIASVVISKKENEEKLKKDFGEIPSTGGFIEKYLNPDGPAYSPRNAATPKEALDLIHGAGGLAVLAHPCWNLTEKIKSRLIFADHWVKTLVGLGLDGIEVWAHRDSVEDTKKCVEHFEVLADKYNLVKTGGSDFHGFGSAGKNLGFEDFYLKVPYEVLENLKKRVASRK